MKIDIIDVVTRTGQGLAQVVKAELITSLVNFFVLLIGLAYAEVPWYGLVAFLIALVDLMPLLGAGIVLIPWAIIVLVMGNFKLALILIVLYLITFLVNQVLQPVILGKSIGLKPIYTLAISLLSILVFGPVPGAIIGSIFSVLLAVVLEIREERQAERIFEEEELIGDDFYRD